MTPQEALDVLQHRWTSATVNERAEAFRVLGVLVHGEQVDPLAVGDVLTDEAGGGYCGNAFGDQSYCDRTVVAVGPNWVAARCRDGRVVVANVDPSSLLEYRRPR